MTFTRRQLCKLTRQLLDYSELCISMAESKFFQEYWDAIRSVNSEKLEMFARFGPRVRNQVMNMITYKHGLRFGFTEIKLNESGWLEKPEWLSFETIDLRWKTDNAVCNQVHIACGKNNKWTYGVDCHLGGGGSGYYPCVAGKLFNSREEALQASLNELSDKVQKGIESHVKNPETSSYKEPYMRAILKVIDDYKSQLQLPSQLVLF